MFKLLAVMLLSVMTMSASDLPSRKYLNLAAIKTMVAASEAKAQELNVQVTICIVDESGNLLFLEKEDGASLNTLQFAQKKARHAAAYGAPSREGAEAVKNGHAGTPGISQSIPLTTGRPARSRGRSASRRDRGQRREVRD